MAKKTYKVLAEFIDIHTGERIAKTAGTFATDDDEQAARLIKAGVLSASGAAAPAAKTTEPETKKTGEENTGGENGGAGTPPATPTRAEKIKFLTDKNIAVAHNISNEKLDALYAENAAAA